MILTESSAARVGGSAVTALISFAGGFHQFFCYTAATISAAITGAVGLVKNGAGALTLAAGCNYTGETKINQGTINFYGPSVLSGVISGAGSIYKNFGSLTLNATNTYTGGTTQAGGGVTINCGASNALGTGIFTSTAGGVGTIIQTNANILLANNFSTTGVLQFRVTAGGINLTLTGAISGNGSLNKTSTGTLTIYGNNTYAGATTLTAGVIRVIKSNSGTTATATFTQTSLSISFDIPPTAGMTFRFFPGTMSRSYGAVTLINAPGRTGSFNSSNSTLTIA